MSTWMLGVVVLNIFLLLAVTVIWVRLSRRPKDDPRLTRGLQLLQSKIAVIEDLSDRTDTQVRQLIEILEERGKHLQRKIIKAEEMMVNIEHSMQKSMSVAEIFQDKIPHEEIVERNQTSKYVQAAKLAHEGVSVDEIANQINLPKSEIEFIAKVNRDELTFNPELLPEWAKPKDVFLSTNTPDLSALKQAEENFLSAVTEHREAAAREEERIKRVEQNVTAVKDAAVNVTGQIVKAASAGIRAAADNKIVRKVQFPRIRLE